MKTGWTALNLIFCAIGYATTQWAVDSYEDSNGCKFFLFYGLQKYKYGTIGKNGACGAFGNDVSH